MSFPLRLRSTLGRSYNANLDDVEPVKKALNGLGYYPIPGYGMTPYPDEFMFQGIERFQRNNGLQVDGIMKPGGETERTLNEVTRPRPITWTALGTHEDREGSGSGSSGGWLGRQPTTDNPDDAGGKQPTQQAAAAAIPFVVHRVAEFFGIGLTAAWTWWQSLSEAQKQSIIRRMDGSAGDGQPDGAKEDCEHLHYKVDIPTCNAISRKRGKQAAARCYQSASARYSACRAGKPKDQWPPLDTWNN